MSEKFEVGDYVFAEDWCYGMVVYVDDKYAEVDFNTENGGGCMTFAVEDLKHAEPPKRRLNYGEQTTI